MKFALSRIFQNFFQKFFGNEKNGESLRRFRFFKDFVLRICYSLQRA